MKSQTIRINDIGNELDELEKKARDLVLELNKKRPEYTSKAYLAEYHIRGLNYHYKNIVKYYNNFVKEVGMRLEVGSEVVWMYSPDYQTMLFEVYALVNLARISLDNLRDYLSPLFITPYNNLPKSVNDFVKGKTECPIYEWIGTQQTFEYLIDLRNCIVHYRSFGINDNTIVSEEGVSVNELTDITKIKLAPMGRAFYRKLDNGGISINIFLPDKIFDKSNNGKKLANFTYQNRWNILSMSRSFAQAASDVILSSMLLVMENDEPLYTYTK